MKKILFLLVVIALLLTACGPSDAECDRVWKSMNVQAKDMQTYAMVLLSKEWEPGSKGAFLTECIESGWDGYDIFK